MTSAELLAALLLLPVFLACLWRARLLAPAILTPLLLALAQWLEVPGLESASHPLRWIVPVACAALAGMALWYYRRRVLGIHRKMTWIDNMPPEWHGVWTRMKTSFLANPNHEPGFFWVNPLSRYRRAALASLLVLGSCAPDLLALHPWFWSFPEWALVPIMIAVEATILAVLLAPERWLAKWL